MRLRHLTTLLAAGALAGLLGLGLFAAYTWFGLTDLLAEERRIAAAHEQAVRLNNAIDYTMMLRQDDVIIAAIVEDAETLATTLAAVDDATARDAGQHLDEIRHAMTLIAGGYPQPAASAIALESQVRAHQMGLMSGLEALLADRDRTLIQTNFQALLVSLAGAVLFGTLCVAGFARVQRRLRGPLAELDRTIEALADGNLEARASVTANDELAELAQHINDMARQRQSDEAELRKSEQRFRQLTENINEVFWLTDLDKTRMIYTSPSYEDTWGRSLAALYEDPAQWLAAIHPDDAARVREAVRQQPQGGYQETYRIVRPDGEIRWITDRAFPVRDDDGDVYRIAGLAEDVTNQVTATAALRERMKELHCLYQVLELTTADQLSTEEIYDRIAAVLPDSLQYAEDAVARVTVAGESFASPGWREPVSRLVASIELQGELQGTVDVGYLAHHPDAPDGNGPFLAEEQSLLDGVASHIGRMLSNRQLAHSLSRAQRLEAVGQLTGGVAHDFNNLLTVIMGNAEMLREDLDDDSAHAETADMILSAAQRGSDLTHRLLAFARRQPLEPRPLDVNKLVADVDGLLRRTLGEQIEIEFTRAAGLWNALADPTQLESALLNLVLNARDAMPGGGHLTIETANTRLGDEYSELQHEVTPGQYVLLAISDTGTGMTAEELSQVFEPFYTTKEEGKGTGLGLSMVYGFVKQSRGHVNIYSEPGQGTTVKMYLPRALEAGTVAEDVPVSTSGNGDETILLVEDDDLVLRYALRQLESLGYAVITARNGHEALERLQQHPDVDLLFTDVIMPGGISCRELADAAQRLNPKIKVLFTSGYTENAIVHQGRLDAGVQLLTKPYRRSDLAERLRRLLGAGDK